MVFGFSSSKKSCILETDFESVEAQQAWFEGSGMEFDDNTSRPRDMEGVVDAFGSEEVDEITITEIPDDSVENMPMPECFK